MKNYYEILEVYPKASKEVIKKAYQVLIKKYHPDLYMGEERIEAEQRAKDINEAYKILSDEFLREQYDAELEKEMQYERSFVEQQNVKKQNIAQEEENISKQEEKRYSEEKEYKIGSFGSLMNLTRTVSRNIPKSNIKNIKDIKKEDWIAAGLTLVVVLILGVVLWFIPATNGFIRSLIPFI